MTRAACASVYFSVLLMALFALLAEARTALNKNKEVAYESLSDYLVAALKLGLVFSPIIAIGVLLGCAREDAKAESEKTAAPPPKK